jgi:hypothetical protein
VSNKWLVMRDELGRICNEAIPTIFLEGPKKKRQSGFPASRPRIDPGMSRISSSANYLTGKFSRVVVYKIF